MRIGFDAKRLYCNFTGLGNYSRSLLKNLGEFYPDNEYYLYTPKIIENPETNSFLKSSAFHTSIYGGVLKSYWRSYSIVNQLKKNNIKLYHGLSHELPVNLHKSGIRSIVSIHDLIFMVYPKTYAAFDRNIYDLKFKYSCKHADRIIAISKSTKEDIINYYNINPDKIDVVYQSCNPLYYQLQEAEEMNVILQQYKIPKEYLLYVGSIVERKNLKALINAYRSLPSNFKIPLVVVGRGNRYKHEVAELIKANGIEKLVLWIDYLENNHHLQALYQNAKAFIYPSLYEGFGLPIVEALLSKTPVITSNASSLPEAGGADSIYMDPNNPVELAESIQKVLTDSELRENMINKGYLYATEHFAPERIAQEMVSSYKKALVL